MKRLILILGLGMFSLTLAWGCGKPEEPAKAPKPAAKPPGALPKQKAEKPEPAKQEPKNQIYDDPSMPIRTQYPADMKMEGGCSGEGCGFTFKLKSRGNALDKAEVHIFLPRGATTAAAQEPFVTGKNGLLENNGWKMAGATTDTGIVPYKWVRKVISFADPRNQDMVGKILLGEASGQAVQVTLFYPGDLDKEFLSNAKMILKNLHFKSDKLPLKKSSL